MGNDRDVHCEARVNLVEAGAGLGFDRTKRGEIASYANEFRWNDFAKQDAFAYIMTGVPQGDRQTFWRSGDNTVLEELLPVVRDNGVPLGTALEIGCGVGRLVFPIAVHFENVVGLDISPEMVRQASEIAAERRIGNVRFLDYQSFQNTLPQLEGRIDFVYSLIVFQHIENFRFIEDYLQHISKLLSSRGVSYLQFDSRKQNAIYNVKNALPDFVLPRFLRRGIRRIRRTPAELEESFSKYHLEILRSVGAFTEYHCYILRKARG